MRLPAWLTDVGQISDRTVTLVSYTVVEPYYAVRSSHGFVEDCGFGIGAMDSCCLVLEVVARLVSSYLVEHADECVCLFVGYVSHCVVSPVITGIPVQVPCRRASPFVPCIRAV